MQPIYGGNGPNVGLDVMLTRRRTGNEAPTTDESIRFGSAIKAFEFFEPLAHLHNKENRQ